MTDTLRAKLGTLPAAPGVYFHKDATGEIIYVGKAAVLKNRVRQYFQNTAKDPKTAALVAEIADTDWIVVDSELDALFLESEMIKRYMPKWNILLRDDKSVTYVRIDLKSPVPYVSFTRNPLDDGADYYGPYYGVRGIKAALRVLRKVCPYYDRPFDGKKTLYTDLGLTPGIEVGHSTAAEYKRNLRKLIQYIRGRRRQLVDQVAREMQAASDRGDYEAAAALRNQYFGLKALATKIIFSDREFLDISSDRALRQLQQLLDLPAPPARIEGYDISHQSGTDVTGSMVVFVNGAADRTKYRKFKLRTQRNHDPAALREVITRRLKHLDDWGRPDLVILDGGEAQLNAVADLLDAAKIPYLANEKSGDHSKQMRSHRILYRANGQLSFIIAHSEDFVKLITRIDDESHRFAITYHRLLKTKTLLK
jgi:excinuclease ABC subunit C